MIYYEGTYSALIITNIITVFKNKTNSQKQNTKNKNEKWKVKI